MTYYSSRTSLTEARNAARDMKRVALVLVEARAPRASSQYWQIADGLARGRVLSRGAM